MSASDWRSHLNALKASKLSQKRIGGTGPGVANLQANVKDTPIDTYLVPSGKENSASLQAEESQNETLQFEESQTSWPDYSGLDDRDRAEESIVEENGVVGNIAKALMFGGGESVEVETGTSSSSTIADNVSHKLTPPRPPTHQPQPVLTNSPSTSKLNSQGSRVQPVQILLPNEKDGARLRLSPTSTRKESTFGQKLQMSGGVTLHTQNDRDAEQNVHRVSPTEKDSDDAPSTDEWKEAYTEKGKKYYYNRRTRASSWKLPVGAVLVEAVTTKEADGFAHAKISSAVVLQTGHTPPSAGDQQQRDSAPHEQINFNDTRVTQHVSRACTDTCLFCIFCGDKVSALDQSLVKHMAACSKGHHGTHQPDVMLSVSAFLAQQLQNLTVTSDLLGKTMLDESVYKELTEKVECSTCGRTFADANRLAKHAPACLESSLNKITPYDGSRKRILGTPMEHMPTSFTSPGKGSARAPSTPNSRPTSSGKKAAHRNNTPPTPPSGVSPSPSSASKTPNRY
jgi:hypothetical protein